MKKFETRIEARGGSAVADVSKSSGLISSIIRFIKFFDTEAFLDGTWASTNEMTWTVIEPGVYLIAACLPNLRPLWFWSKERMPSLRWSRSETSATSSVAKRSDYIELGQRGSAKGAINRSSSSKEGWDGGMLASVNEATVV